MALSDHVNLTIVQETAGVSRAGFGTPLILSHDDTLGWVERVRVYTSLGGVSGDFATSSPEYLAASALFSQNPRPKRLKIGRANEAGEIPTQSYTITPTAVDDATYRIRVRGDGVTEEVVEFTADSSATVAEITAGLEAALNGVTGANFTATDNTTDVSVVGDAAGNWFSLEVLDITLLDIVQDHAAPASLEDALNAIQNEDGDWYCLLTNFNSPAYGGVAWVWVEARRKIYAFDSNESASATTVAGGGDALDLLESQNRRRTSGMYHPSPAEMAAAAWMGTFLSLDPGSVTGKYRQPSGPVATRLTDTQRANLRARNANFIETTASKDHVSEGTTGDGSFLDIVRDLDKVQDDVEKSVFETLLGSTKVPYTDEGVHTVVTSILGALKRAVNEGILSPDVEPVVIAPLVADVPVSERANRNLPDIEFSATLAGAIHTVEIDGVVSV